MTKVSEISSKRSAGAKSRPSRRSQGTVLSSNTQKRVETTGDKQSAAHIEILDNSSGGQEDVSINIQTDAAFNFKSFDKRGDDNSTTTYNMQEGYKQQKSTVSFKSKSSKRSQGTYGKLKLQSSAGMRD